METHFEKVGIIKAISETIRSLLEGKVDRSMSEEINSQISKSLGDGLGNYLNRFNFYEFPLYYCELS